ncbi:caspase-2 [Galendromus occidentalis]|uniref:Caspase-2 n=1 Tax=Galendromus occidentalis TaxID=34638 RepID=A0AAJ6VUX2_9ACAR|nr:caspase-2 [Galendromus occidentalis]
MGTASTSSSSTSVTLPSMVTVTKAKQIAVGKEVYEMTDSPRGLCVIFNNRHFPCVPDRDRPGSELDVQRMMMLFKEFKFMVFTHEDQTSQQIMSLLDTYANEKVLEGHQAFVLIMMSHGEVNHIYGNDYNLVKLQDIFEKFNNYNCPALRERPKLFFIQSCRGGLSDNGVPGRDLIAEAVPGEDGTQSDAGPFKSQGYPGVSRTPSPRISYWSDTYIAYAVVEGYESLRDLNSGSWFLKAVFDVMANDAHTEHLDTLMDRVSQRVLERVRRDGQRQCPEVKKIGWRKKLFFNPGLSQ